MLPLTVGLLMVFLFDFSVGLMLVTRGYEVGGEGGSFITIFNFHMIMGLTSIVQNLLFCVNLYHLSDSPSYVLGQTNQKCYCVQKKYMRKTTVVKEGKVHKYGSNK